MKNIQIVLDMSMSMKECVGSVYIFLEQFLNRLFTASEPSWSLQLTVFSGGQVKNVAFEEEKSYTGEKSEFLRILAQQSLKTGTPTCEEDIESACLSSIGHMHGRPGEQILVLFTDYYAEKVISLTRRKGVNRAVLFLPGNSGRRYRFHMVDQDGRFNPIIPASVWNLERLQNVFSEEDWECLLACVKGGDEDA